MADQDTDTEITLGAGRLLSLFFGLVVVCALFFVVGYRLGRSAATPTTMLTSAVAPPLPDSPAVRPGASQGAIVIKDCTGTPGGCGPANAAPSTTSGEGTGSAAATNSSGASPTQNPPFVPPEVAKGAIQSGYIVQVAAVSKQQDAEALVSALRNKQYPVFILTPETDSLFHIQIGPFTDLKDAEAIRSRLVADGYNPILKR